MYFNKVFKQFFTAHYGLFVLLKSESFPSPRVQLTNANQLLASLSSNVASIRYVVYMEAYPRQKVTIKRALNWSRFEKEKPHP